MLSLLRRLALSGSLFRQGDEGHWLVWEKGGSAPTGSFDLTPGPGDAAASMPLRDSITFHLERRVPLRIGRSSICEIVINDATVSREHVLLEPEGTAGWTARVITPRGATVAAGVSLGAGESRALASGDTLRLGDTLLTLLDSAAFKRRLLPAVTDAR